MEVRRLKRIDGPIVILVPESWNNSIPLEVRGWFKDNQITEYSASLSYYQNGKEFVKRLAFCFYDESDAVLFKTTWL